MLVAIVALAVVLLVVIFIHRTKTAVQQQTSRAGSFRSQRVALNRSEALPSQSNPREYASLLRWSQGAEEVVFAKLRATQCPLRCEDAQWLGLEMDLSAQASVASAIESLIVALSYGLLLRRVVVPVPVDADRLGATLFAGCSEHAHVGCWLQELTCCSFAAISSSSQRSPGNVYTVERGRVLNPRDDGVYRGDITPLRIDEQPVVLLPAHFLKSNVIWTEELWQELVALSVSASSPQARRDPAMWVEGLHPSQTAAAGMTPNSEMFLSTSLSAVPADQRGFMLRALIAKWLLLAMPPHSRVASLAGATEAVLTRIGGSSSSSNANAPLGDVPRPPQLWPCVAVLTPVDQRSDELIGTDVRSPDCALPLTCCCVLLPVAGVARAASKALARWRPSATRLPVPVLWLADGAETIEALEQAAAARGHSEWEDFLLLGACLYPSLVFVSGPTADQLQLLSTTLFQPARSVLYDPHLPRARASDSTTSIPKGLAVHDAWLAGFWLAAQYADVAVCSFARADCRLLAELIASRKRIVQVAASGPVSVGSGMPAVPWRDSNLDG